MAKYKVLFPRSEEAQEKERKRHCDGWKVSPFYRVDIDIDFFISAILACEYSGIMIRRTMEALCPIFRRHPRKDADLIIGKIFWAADKKLMRHKYGDIFNETEVNVTFLRQLGEAFIKCYRVAEKFDVIGSTRNDDRFRYWCNFKMYDNYYTFKHLILDSWFRQTQVDEAKKHASINNTTYLLTLWDEYMKINFDEIRNLDTYTKNKVKNEVGDKVSKAIKYLQCIRYFFDKGYSEVEVINGKERRIQKIFPTELYSMYLIKARYIIQRAVETADELDIIARAQHTLDKSTFNFYVLDNVEHNLRYLNEVWENLIYQMTDKDLSIRKLMKDSDKRRLHIYDNKRYNEVMSEDSEVKRCFGYYCYGERYSRMPNNAGDNRVRIFI